MFEAKKLFLHHLSDFFQRFLRLHQFHERFAPSGRNSHMDFAISGMIFNPIKSASANMPVFGKPNAPLMTVFAISIEMPSRLASHMATSIQKMVMRLPMKPGVSFAIITFLPSTRSAKCPMLDLPNSSRDSKLVLRLYSLLYYPKFSASSSTSAAWPGTLFTSQILRMTPFLLIRKVARWMPMYFLPYMFFSTQQS